MLFIIHVHQQGTHQWTRFQVKGTPRIYCRQTFGFSFALCFRKPAQVYYRHRKRFWNWVYGLYKLVSYDVKSRPPDLMAPNDFKQAPLDHCYIERSLAADRYGLVIERYVARHLPMEPHLLLRKRKGSKLSGRTRADASLFHGMPSQFTA